MAAPNAKKLKKRIAEIRRRKSERKMDPFSQLIHDFCRPLLAVAEELSGPENAVSLGVFAWNAAFLPEDRWRANLRLSLVRFGLADDTQEALEGIVEEMIRQKLLMFPDDRRVVTRFDVTARDGAVFVEAACRTATRELMPNLRPEYDITAPTGDAASGCSGCATATGCPSAGSCPSAGCNPADTPGAGVLLPGQQPGHAPRAAADPANAQPAAASDPAGEADTGPDAR